MYNVAAVMNDEAAAAEIKKLQAAMEADPVVGKLMDAAETVEDMYEVAKRYVEIKLEDFRELFSEAMDYFKGSKVELDDEVMECVAGGASWGGFWKVFKKVAVAAAIGLAVGAVCVATGGAAGAALGALGAYVAGSSVAGAAAGGFVTGAVTATCLGTYNMVKGATSN